MTYALDTIFKGYATAALWSSCDENQPLDDDYSIDDLSEECKKEMMKDCQDFIDKIDNTGEFLLNGLDLETSGHDFWLTRCGHGCGFWDGDYEEEIGEKLTAICKEMGERWLFVQDDGEIGIM